MDKGDAEELGRLRRNIRDASAEVLLPIIATALDNLIDIARSLPGGSCLGVEVAAALAAELHRRNQPVAWAAVVGNA